MKRLLSGAFWWRLWRAYRLRWKRRYFLGRAIRRRRQLRPILDRTNAIGPDDILLFSVVQNEANRLPHFLDYHRLRGVSHFLIVDNNSTDETSEILTSAPDVSVWFTDADYKRSRFGVDWTTWLQFKFGHGHWCLTLDADELFLTPYDGERDFRELVFWLDQIGAQAMGALMVDLYPDGPLSKAQIKPGDCPLDVLQWFDADEYDFAPRPEVNASIARGGVRMRKYFEQEPLRAPTMNKVPLVKWNRRFAYLTSTHVILPKRLNSVGTQSDVALPSAVLLHTKFLAEMVDKARRPEYRASHFENSALYESYYDDLAADPTLWTTASAKFKGWQDLVRQNFMQTGDW